MKALLKLLLLTTYLVRTSAYAERNPYTCSMGDYDFKGAYYSDSYQVPATVGQGSCTDRDKMEAETINKSYKENHKKIRDQIEKMQNDTQCIHLKPLLDEYLKNYKKNEDQFNQLTNIRTEFVAEKIKQYDVQKAYAYAGAFNGTCSGGHNRETSFINLEFINKLPLSESEKTQVTKDGEEVDSCADVNAGGDDDLKSFFVSTKKASGKDFLFTWDPYGVPDQVIVKSKSGQILYDSGCKGSADLSPEPIKLPVQKDGIVINVINTCENPAVKSSAWNLRIQCAQTSDACKEPREELIRLVKEEVNQTKVLIDANKLQQQCYMFIDKDILGDLLQDGMITEESGPKTNGLCDVADDSCSNKIDQNSKGENSKKGMSSILPYREPSQEQFSCPTHQEVKDSLFKTVSYAYCKHGWKRLGLDETVPE